MHNDIKPDSRFQATKDVVVREVMGKLLLVPLTSGVGNMEDEIYTLNDSGRAIWDRLISGNSVEAIVTALCAEFECEAGEIERDIAGLLRELLQRRIVEEIK